MNSNSASVNKKSVAISDTLNFKSPLETANSNQNYWLNSNERFKYLFAILLTSLYFGFAILIYFNFSLNIKKAIDKTTKGSLKSFGLAHSRSNVLKLLLGGFTLVVLFDILVFELLNEVSSAIISSIVTFLFSTIEKEEDNETKTEQAKTGTPIEVFPNSKNIKSIIINY
ncbi:MAG: hypothetical protein SFY32_10750 [Bacteroidota bacterium]|nr:hypothetical protein [Bacteroidota bacterium]